jgi:hypothetical protein
MNRLLYEKSIYYLGYLMIPFHFRRLDNRQLYSYKLLSDRGWKGKFHKTENPAGLYCDSIEATIDIAREHLDIHSDSSSREDLFQDRYIYRNNLFIIYEEVGKCFYDHYPPENLNNIAAPKIFTSKVECIAWITRELKQRTPETKDRRSIR